MTKVTSKTADGKVQQPSTKTVPVLSYKMLHYNMVMSKVLSKNFSVSQKWVGDLVYLTSDIRI